MDFACILNLEGIVWATLEFFDKGIKRKSAVEAFGFHRRVNGSGFVGLSRS